VVHGDGMYVFGGQQQRTGSGAQGELSQAARSSQMFRLQLRTTPACSLATDWLAFWQSGELCDLELVIGGVDGMTGKEGVEEGISDAAPSIEPQVVPCHVCVVAARSPVLAKAILAEMAAKSDPTDIPSGRRLQVRFHPPPYPRFLPSHASTFKCPP